MKRFLLLPAAAMIIGFPAGLPGRGPQARPVVIPGLSTAPLPGLPAAVRDFGRMPLQFIPNRGQVDGRVAFYLQGRDKTVYFTSEGLTFVLSGTGPGAAGRPAGRYALKLDFLGAAPDTRLSGEGKTGAVISYFTGNEADWRAGLPAYSRIVYRDLWPGIDLAYFGTPDKLKYEFVVEPGADPSVIRLAYRGASGLSVNSDGGLAVETPAGGFEDDPPLGYQEIDGRKAAVPLAYRIDASAGAEGGLAYGFEVGAYDPSRPLVLDPAVRVYCGYIGGAAADEARDIAVDRAGCAYIVGTTVSAQPSFPVKTGPDLTNNGGNEVFVAKVNASGSALVYCGFLGGKKDDVGQGIAVDARGNAYVTGHTESAEDSFPIKVGPDLTLGGSCDAFVAKVNAYGTKLVYCGYIGGSSFDDRGRAIAVDSHGCAYVVGAAWSNEATFPRKAGPDLTWNGDRDAFVAKVYASGEGLSYCGYIGGKSGDFATGIALDKLGNAYVTGRTDSNSRSFPVRNGPDSKYHGGGDAFVAKVKTGGGGLSFCGYIGGSSYETGNDIALDASGNVYIAGVTASTEATFPVKGGPDLTWNGDQDGFVVKLKNSLVLGARR